MKVIKATQQMLETRTLVLGFQGENLRTQLRIDCSATFAEYPNATPALAIKPPTGETYPVFVDRDGTEVVWDIVANNLILKGDGELQLTFYKDNVIAKTSVGHITVNRSLQIDGDMPDVVATWIENANRKLAEVDAQIVELEGMVDTATDAATRAEQSASTASTKAEQAAGSAATATEKATEATNAAGTATAKAAEAQTAALTATQKATAAADSERIATAKAVEATTAAGTATTKAEQATEAAQTATEKARDASASATAAHASEINAAESADGAFSAEVGANAAKRAAETSATQAGISEQNAGIAAQTATQKAAEATQSATDAEIFAGTATTKAEEAAASAQAASDAKTAVEETAEQLAESLEQISQNTADIAEHEQEYNALKESTLIHSTASGSIASFSDGAEMPVDEVTAQINPVQDLHGYENPWPAGGNLNLLDFSKVSVSGTHYGMTFSKGTAEGTIVISGTLTTSSGSVAPITYANNSLSGKGYVFLTEHISGDSVIALNRTYGFRTESERAIAVYLEGNAGQSYTETIRVSVYATTQTAWTPYANSCPITGFDGLTVTRTGKNLLDPAKKRYVQSNMYFYYDDGLLLNAGTYTLSYKGSETMSGIYATQYPVGGSAIAFKYNTKSLTFTIQKQTRVIFNYYLAGGTALPDDATKYQLEVGSTDTDYEPYSGTTYDITFPSEAGTVYGGSLSIAEDGSGVLTVDSELEIFNQELENEISSGLDYLNLRSGSVSAVGNYTRISFAGPSDRAKYNLISGTYERKMCNILSHVFSYADESTHWYRNTVLYVFFPTSVVGSTNESVIAYLKSLATAGTPLTFWIPFAEPVAYTLTASEIRTLLGENHLWHDANGDISVGYKANTKLYIDGKIAELVAQIVNS